MSADSRTVFLLDFAILRIDGHLHSVDKELGEL